MMKTSGFFAIAASVCLLAGMEAMAATATVRQLRTASQDAARMDAVKSAQIVYAIDGGNSDAKMMVVRAKRFDKVRLDVVMDKGYLSSVRNGGDFWCADENGKVSTMDADERDAFTRYIEMLPVPFYSKSIFDKPAILDDDDDDDDDHLEYKVKAIGGVTLEITVDKETKDVLCVESDNEEYPVNLTYGNYCTVDGIRIARRINIVMADQKFSMKLADVRWNAKLDDGIFDKSSKAEKIEIDVDGGASPVAYVNDKSSSDAKRQKKIAKLEKKIGKLKLEIDFNEKRLEKMETLLKVGYQESKTLEAKAEKKSERRYYWNGYCWNRHRESTHRSTREARKKADELGKEMEKMVKEYKELNKKLLKQRTKLSEAELELDQCKR